MRRPTSSLVSGGDSRRDMALGLGVSPAALDRYAGPLFGGEGVEIRDGTAYLQGPIVDEDIGDILRSFGDNGFISPSKVRDAVADGTTALRLNSPGGSVWASAEMRQDIRASAVESITVSGLAASAATTLFAAAPNRYITPMSMVMVHKSWMNLAGNSDDLRRYAAMLENNDAEYVRDIAAGFGGTADEWAARLESEPETWFTAQQFIDHGYAQAAPDGEGESGEPAGDVAGAEALAVAEAARATATTLIRASAHLRARRRI